MALRQTAEFFRPVEWSGRAGRRIRNIEGVRFGSLVPICAVGHSPCDGSVYWQCACDCGKTVIVRGKSMCQGLSKTCGCRHGKPLGEIFLDHIRKDESGCWEWLGAKDNNGYGVIRIMGERRFAHRISHEIHKGLIPDGFHIDHLCRNTSCANPDHLEAVTPKENVLRGVGVAAINAKKTLCVRGHELAGENLYIYRGERICVACRRFHSSKRRACCKP